MATFKYDGQGGEPIGVTLTIELSMSDYGKLCELKELTAKPNNSSSIVAHALDVALLVNKALSQGEEFILRDPKTYIEKRITYRPELKK